MTGAEPGGHPEPGRPRVLIVDDNESVLGVMTTVLESAGYRLDSTRDAESAARLLDVNTYDCVVSDVVMPGKGGLWLLKQVREQHPATPVILVTGSAVPGARADARGAHAWLEKPFRPAELIAAVERAFAAREP
jgi:CheY-like chemotaxis protein